MLALPLRGSTPELYHGKYVAGMFGSGEQGAWYDPSDLSTLYQDAAGTIPVTAVGQPVGKILDKSGRGNHATQSTTTSRPTLSARVNMLTKTEQFNDSTVWATAGRATITANDATAPDGTLTADRITETVDYSTHRVFQLFSFQPNTTYTASVCWKKGTRRWVWIAFQTDSSPTTQIIQWFDLDTATLGSSSTGAGGTQGSKVAASITALGNDWYRCSLTAAFGATVTSFSSIGFYTGVSNTDRLNSYAGSTSEYNWLWGADIRAANESANLPAYQRVNTDTDYDTAGFPYYLLFDGVDDYLSTGSIDFTGTDKMTVFAGVSKLSDAENGIVVELSANRSANAGAISLHAPGGGGNNQYLFASRGTVDGAFAVVSPRTYPTPQTAVLTGIGNISGDQSLLRVNGSTAAIAGAIDQGSGNYGNFPLYIGRRNGASLPFSGNLYGLIVRGAQTDDLHLTHAEKYLAYKLGVSL